jgi:hypothetical protein
VKTDYAKPTMLPRCSKHNLGKLVDYSADSISLYPDGPPTHDVEVLIHKLNLQAFPSSSYARVDDILVYALLYCFDHNFMNFSILKTFLP